MKIQASAENYLEAIFVLQNRNGHVRSIDVATELGYSKPSVSRGMKLLRQNKHIEMEEDGLIRLTESGLQIAAEIHERHTLLTAFLTGLGVAEEIAKDDACRIEHVISQETFDRLKVFVNAGKLDD
ncbi:MAG: metal-dependent transcriptional regulator [Oscillospiraceae bacterium]|nr:metal-dependent transcriptional regulator [Oscillospiraceae bacterium]